MVSLVGVITAVTSAKVGAVEVVVSVAVSDSSGAVQEVTPSARKDTRNSVSKMYRRKLEMDISQLSVGIVKHISI